MNLPTCISSNRKIRYTVCFVVLVALLVIFFTISVCAGSVQISISDILRQFRGEQDELYAAILFQIRIPRTFAAILLGGALALSGYLLQTFFHNPIAGPFVLGISSGAKMMVTFASDAEIVNLHNWSMGSFSGITWENVKTIVFVVAVTGILTFFLSKPMEAYQLGETYAKNMGVNIKMFRILLVILSSILSAVVTAFAGPVSFVGIAVPQMVKRLFRTAKPIIMIPACFLGGAVFCMFCDLLARMVFAPTEMSISTVTAIFGAPVMIAVMLKQRQERY